MAAVNGTLYAVFNGAAGAMAAADRLWSCKNATLKVDVDLPDVSTKESGAWAQHITGLKNWSIDFSGVWDETASVASEITPAEILGYIIARTADATCGFLPAALGTTLPGWSGLATFKNLTITGDMETGITFAGSVVGNAALALFSA